MKQLLFMLILVAGCRVSGPGRELDRLLEQRSRWEALGIRNYDVDYRKACFCPPPRTIRIEVRNNVVVAATYLDNDEVISALSWVPTVDSVFAWSERNLGFNYRLAITYHPTLHFPTQIDGDIPTAVDDEYQLTLTNLVQR